MEILLKYFSGLTDTQIEKYQRLVELYRLWNEKINVISRKDIDHLYLKHILHSLAIARYITFTSGTRILDIGTGGGFPGIPLAILFPETEFLLVDSIAKKIKVVHEVIRELGLSNTKALQIRAENVKGTFDFIVSRAVAPLPVMLEWVGKKIKKEKQNQVHNGLLALKGGDLITETDIPNKLKIKNIADYFSEPFFETKKLIHVFV